MNRENIGEILKARARELAAEPQAVDGGAGLDLIVFRLASEEYAIEAAYVSEVFSLRDYAELPGTPPFILGIANLRGRILSLVDLKIFFGLPARGLGNLDKVIVLRRGTMEFGILADQVSASRKIAAATVQAPLPTLTGIGGDFVKGVTAERLIVLDAGKIISDERLIVRDGID